MWTPLLRDVEYEEDAQRVPWGAGAFIPRWFVDKDAVNFKLDRFDLDNGSGIFNYVGPAILRAWTAFRWTWTMWMLTPIITFLLMPFGDHTGFGLPEPPVWLVPTLLICIFPLIYLEWRVLGILLVPLAYWLTSISPMTIMTIPVGFPVSIAFYGMLSFVGHMDVVFNGVFVIRTLASYQSKTHMPAVWALVLQESLLGPSIPIPPFCVIALVGWLLMGLQAAYAVGNALPRSGLDTQGNEIKYGYGTEDAAIYATWRDSATAHNKALPALFDVSRMSALISSYFDAANKELHFSSNARTQIPYMYHMQLRLTVAKFAFFSLLESAFLANVQVMVIGLSKAAEPNHAVDVLTVVSVVIGFATGMYTLGKEYYKAKKILEGIMDTDIEGELRNECYEGGGCQTEIDSHVQSLRRVEFENDTAWSQYLEGNPDESERRSNFIFVQTSLLGGERAQQTAPRLFKLFLAIVALYLVLMGRAMAQLCGIIVCDTGLFNMGVGCVSEALLHPVLDGR